MSIIKNLYSIETGNFKLDGGAMFGVVPKTIWEKTNPADDLNMINMAAGDSSIWGKEYSVMEYTGHILSSIPNKRKNIIDLIKSKGNKEPQNIGKFRYSNAIADLVARVIDNVSPNGIVFFSLEVVFIPTGVVFTIKSASSIKF